MGWEVLSSYMCLDHVARAGNFNVTEVYDEILDEWSSVHCKDVLYQALAVLPMCSSWSLFCCHGILTEAMREGEARRHKTTQRLPLQVAQRPAASTESQQPQSDLGPVRRVDNANLLCWGAVKVEQRLPL